LELAEDGALTRSPTVSTFFISTKTTANPSDIEHEITVEFKQENTVANDLVL